MGLVFSPFVNAMSRTFREMVGVELVHGPYEEMEGNEVLADVSTNIGLSGESRAVLLLTADEAAALKVTKLTTGKDVAIHDKLVTDTIGELLNVFVGAAQRHSNIKFNFSIPMAVSGKNHTISSLFNRGRRQRVVSKMEGSEVSLYLIEGVEGT